MTMKTSEEYFESIRALCLPVYLFGELVEDTVEHPIIRPSLNAVGMTYEISHQPEFEDLATATSHLSGNKINRFCHIHQNIDDLLRKPRLLRLMGRKTGTCFQRCVGLDGINALTPPPVGNTPFEFTLDELGDDLIIFGGVLDEGVFQKEGVSAEGAEG